MFSLQEAGVNIRNLEKKFGSFNFAPKFTLPVRGDRERNLDKIIPRFHNPISPPFNDPISDENNSSEDVHSSSMPNIDDTGPVY